MKTPHHTKSFVTPQGNAQLRVPHPRGGPHIPGFGICGKCRMPQHVLGRGYLSGAIVREGLSKVATQLPLASLFQNECSVAQSRNETKMPGVPHLARRQPVLSMVSNERCNSPMPLRVKLFTCISSSWHGDGGRISGLRGLHEVSLGHFRASNFSCNNAAAELRRRSHHCAAQKAPLQVPPCNREPVHAEEDGALQARHA